MNGADKLAEFLRGVCYVLVPLAGAVVLGALVAWWITPGYAR